jgi:hypothetical protein
MNAEISNPIDSLAADIAAARSFYDLGEVRRRLQHTLGLLDEERRVLENALIEREKSLIHFYLPHRA